jgi:drug/metabolite transporter (DMT)-like permease
MKTTLASFLDWCQAPARDRKNQRWIILWSLLWMASWVTLILAIENEWIERGWPVVVGTVVTLPPALLTLFAYRRYLREADELRRKIELDALALAFGVGLVGGFSFFALARGGLVAMDDFLFVIMAMVATHSVGVWIGHRRYS